MYAVGQLYLVCLRSKVLDFNHVKTASFGIFPYVMVPKSAYQKTQTLFRWLPSEPKIKSRDGVKKVLKIIKNCGAHGGSNSLKNGLLPP